LSPDLYKNRLWTEYFETRIRQKCAATVLLFTNISRPNTGLDIFPNAPISIGEFNKRKQGRELNIEDLSAGKLSERVQS